MSKASHRVGRRTEEPLAALNDTRRTAGKPIATVDLALYSGEVLYGNVGAIDWLDFTVVGPAVNEVARIDALCEPLNRSVLVSAAFAASTGSGSSLRLDDLARTTKLHFWTDLTLFVAL